MEKTYREALQEAAALLTEAGVPDPEQDAWFLLSHVTGMSRAKYFMDQRERMPADRLASFREMIRQRADRIPLQHLLGEAWFMGLPFYVDGSVLIPRLDTEKLVELVLAWLKRREKDRTPQADRRTPREAGNAPAADGRRLSEAAPAADGRRLSEAGKGTPSDPDAPTLLDMCTGSGCIAVSLERLGHWASVTGADISEEALATAARNGERNGSAVGWIQSDLFASFPGERFDVIVSNPPYIPTAECETLMPEVRDHDPRLALDGREDGLYFYRRLAAECPAHLKAGGRVFFEIGWDQGEAVAELLEQAGFRQVRVFPDDTGKDRVVTGEYYV